MRRILVNLIRRLTALYAEDVIGLDVIELELSDGGPDVLRGGQGDDILAIPEPKLS